MARTRIAVFLAVAACSTLGLAGVGLTNPLTPSMNPPTDAHGKQPAAAPASKSLKKSEPSPVKKAAPAEKKETEKASEPKSGHEEPGDEHAEPAAKPVADEHADGAKDDDHGPPVVKPVKPVFKDDAKDDAPDADRALEMLREGNDRWVNNQVTAPNTDTARREDVASNGQKPFATVLTCSDSRLPVERVFDRGVGEVFVVRVAGNVVSGEVAGTIEYGAEHLKVPLLVVMGHTKCGAVAAAASGATIEGNIGLLVEKITPAVNRVKQQTPNADQGKLAAAAVKENVWQGVFDLLRTSSEVRHLVHDGKIKVVGAVCDVATGKVEWLGEHPWQDALVDAFEARDAKSSTKVQTADAEKEH